MRSGGYTNNPAGYPSLPPAKHSAVVARHHSDYNATQMALSPISARTGFGLAALAAFTCGAARPAGAQVERELPGGEAPAADVETPEDADPKNAARAVQSKGKGKAGTWTFSGRVVAGATYFDDTTYQPGGAEVGTSRSLDLTIKSSRVGLKYHILDWLLADIEIDPTEKSSGKDMFLQAKSKHFLARVGQFKLPISSIELESPWTLPLADRGLIHKLLVDRLLVAGRSPGALVQVRGGGWLHPALALGAFQGSDAQPLGRTLAGAGVDSQTTVARLSVSPGALQLAAFAGRRSTRVPLEISHHWFFGGDAQLDIGFEGHALRVWADAVAGSSWYGNDLQNAASTTTFASARTIVAWRWGGMADGESYLEPFSMVGALNPGTNNTDDAIWEAFAGLNLGYWRKARVTLQVEMSRTGKQAPAQLFPLGVTLTDHKAMVLQAGAAF